MQADAGKLQLDAPISPLVDPWLKTQGIPSLAELWNGDPTISSVTPRQLLSMRGGIRDYDDMALRRWTVENPTKDWLPLDFVHNVSKKFLFRPGTGGSSDGGVAKPVATARMVKRSATTFICAQGG